MSFFWRKKVLMAKVETTYGTDATPSAAANAIRALEVRLMPMEGSDTDRNLDEPWLGASGTIPTDLHAKITFKVELAPSGTAGTAPGWGVLLKACGCAETVTAATDVVYNPVSEDHDSATIYLNIDGTLYALVGARGTCAITASASGIPYLEFEFTGLYVRPSAQALPTPDYSVFQKPRLASNTFTPVFSIDSTDLVLRSFKLDLGNQVETDFLIGVEEVFIQDRADMIEAQVRAVALGTFNPFAMAEDAAEVELQLQHGTEAGHIATLEVPAAQVQRVQGLEEGKGRKEWPLRLQPLPQAGNDQWTLTLT